MMKNAMTVDVEDYFHVSAFSDCIPRSGWKDLPDRVEKNTQRILDLFDAHSIKSTFFVLGWVAERHPGLVREIHARGHEVACHGYSHQLVYSQTQDVFFQETRKAKALLEDQVQSEVIGYRAASYSITAKSMWALDILADLGFKYDSSIFPVRHDRYGIPDGLRFPHIIETPAGSKLIEYPLSTYTLAGVRIPVAGGGYFRLFPYWLTAGALSRINSQDMQPFIFYLHPWEIDPEQPRVDAARWLSRYRHYNNLDKTEARLVRLLAEFQFGTVSEVLTRLHFDC